MWKVIHKIIIGCNLNNQPVGESPQAHSTCVLNNLIIVYNFHNRMAQGGLWHLVLLAHIALLNGHDV